MSSNLPQKFTANWVANEVVMPADVNSWESAINTLIDDIPIYAATGDFYSIDSIDTSGVSEDVINLVPVSYSSSDNQMMSEYRDGMKVRFLCTSAGDSSKYVQIKVGSLSVKNIKDSNSQQRVQGNVIKAGYYLDCTYNSLNSCFYLGKVAPDVDNSTVGLNVNDRLQAIGIIDNRSNNALKVWTGTKAQYDAITTKDENTIYNITDDTDVTFTLLEALYPVGSIYIGTMSTCPLAVLGIGTWQLKSANSIVTSVSASSTTPVKGTGKSLGITDGSTTYKGIINGGNGVVYNNTGSFNVDVGTVATAALSGTTNASLGVVTDGTKSGLVADTSSLLTTTAISVNIWERIS